MAKDNHNISKELTGVIPKPPQKTVLKWGILWTDLIAILFGLVIGILVIMMASSWWKLLVNSKHDL